MCINIKNFILQAISTHLVTKYTNLNDVNTLSYFLYYDYAMISPLISVPSLKNNVKAVYNSLRSSSVSCLKQSQSKW